MAANRRLGAHGAELVPVGARILTHCNAGWLATAGYGTALGIVRGAVEAGRRPFVWVDETRPLLQGARLTAWELAREGIPHAVIADVAAASTMARFRTREPWLPPKTRSRRVTAEASMRGTPKNSGRTGVPVTTPGLAR